MAAGNACVVKPAEDACLSVIRVAELAADVGFPAGALNIVTGYGAEAGAALAQHRGIDHISFTGSPATGTAVAQAAAKHHCPVTLELGGKSPQIVFADARLDDVLPVVVNAIVQNAGQTCSAGSRLLIERPIYDELVARVGHAMSQLKVGPALDDLDAGPLIRQNQLQRVWDFLSRASTTTFDRGARQHRRARRKRLPGTYVARDVPSNHVLARKKSSGPCSPRVSTPKTRCCRSPMARCAASWPVWTRWRAPDASRAPRAADGFIGNYGAGGGIGCRSAA